MAMPGVGQTPGCRCQLLLGRMPFTRIVYPNFSRREKVQYPIPPENSVFCGDTLPGITAYFPATPENKTLPSVGN